MRSFLCWTILGTLLLAAPARAENTVPSAELQEILIKTSLLTLNDANLTGNYTVLHARLAKAFRDQITPDGLKKGFKTFADQKVDFGLIATKPPIVSSAARCSCAATSTPSQAASATSLISCRPKASGNPSC